MIRACKIIIKARPDPSSLDTQCEGGRQKAGLIFQDMLQTGIIDLPKKILYVLCECVLCPLEHKKCKSK